MFSHQSRWTWYRRRAGLCNKKKKHKVYRLERLALDGRIRGNFSSISSIIPMNLILKVVKFMFFSSWENLRWVTTGCTFYLGWGSLWTLTFCVLPEFPSALHMGPGYGKGWRGRRQTRKWEPGGCGVSHFPTACRLHAVDTGLCHCVGHWTLVFY